jgi:hypothetical protein
VTREPHEPEHGGPSHLWWLLAVLAAALAPHLGSLGAPWISEDSAALAYVHRAGPWADWCQGQYGMRIVRFWRPLVTTTLGVQEAWTGIAPAPLRAFNLLGHAAAAVLAGLLALRLGGRRRGACAAGVLAALFPDVGGTVTWIVGRVDSQTVPLVLGAAWAAMRRGRSPAWSVSAGALAFLAASSKELGFAAPGIGLALLWGAADERGLARVRSALAGAAPLFAGAGVAFLLRRLALGAWVGGYPPPPFGARDLLAAAVLVLRLFAWPLAALAAVALVGALSARAARSDRPTERWSAPAAAALAALLALGPLLPLLADGVLEPQNRRVLFLADALLATALGAALGRVRGAPAALALVAVAALFPQRGAAARADVREWVASAELAAARVDHARAALASAPPSDEPLLDATFPRVHGGAYCLAWGVADRFRAPFEATPRPVWPLRLMFVAGAAARARPPVTPPRDAPELPVSVGSRRDFGALAIEVDVARGLGPELELWGDYPAAARVEALVYTELGYEAAVLGPAAFGPPEPGPDGPDGPDGTARPVMRVRLGAVLRASAVASLGEALLQAADAGARRAYLELRVVDGAQAPPLAASRRIPLTWSPDLPARLAAIDAAGGG